MFYIKLIHNWGSYGWSKFCSQSLVFIPDSFSIFIRTSGRSKGGFTTKIHALVDGLGNPLKFILTAGQRNDITQAEALTENVTNSTVIADKGYDSNAFIASLESKDCEIIIPPKRNRKVQRDYDKHLYKERHLVECFFGKIKHFRFDKTSIVFMGFLNFVGSLIWLL